jgi:hypothetical protein
VNAITNNETKLLRTLINIVYKYEIEIIDFLYSFYSEAELKGKFKFIIDDEGFERFRRYKGKITQTNLQNLFHIREATFELWVGAEWTIDSIARVTYVNLLTSIKHFPDAARSKFWEAILEYTTKKTDDLDFWFISEMLLIFNENTKDFFNFRRITDVLKFHSAFFSQNFCNDVKYETYNKYFNLLVRTYLLNTSELSITTENMKVLKEKFYDLVITIITSKNMIEQNRTDEFEILFYTLLVFNKIKMLYEGVDFELFELADLSEHVSEMDYRYLFSDGFREDYSIKRQCVKLYDLIDDISENIDIVECEIAKKKIKVYLEYWQREYHDYWQDLYPTHIKDLLIMTLGLDVANLTFFSDAEIKTWQVGNQTIFIYRIDVDRHHLDHDTTYYLPYYYDESSGYIPKLAPLSHGAHFKLTNLYQSRQIETLDYLNLLYEYRLIHLFELINCDIDSPIGEEFEKKVVIIKGIVVQLWEDIDDSIINEWKRRWLNSKIMSEDEFLDTYYKIFYSSKYRPHLRKMRNISPSFWYWYNNHYLTEIDNLLMKFRTFYNNL